MNQNILLVLLLASFCLYPAIYLPFVFYLKRIGIEDVLIMGITPLFSALYVYSHTFLLGIYKIYDVHLAPDEHKKSDIWKKEEDFFIIINFYVISFWILSYFSVLNIDTLLEHMIGSLVLYALMLLILELLRKFLEYICIRNKEYFYEKIKILYKPKKLNKILIDQIHAIKTVILLFYIFVLISFFLVLVFPITNKYKYVIAVCLVTGLFLFIGFLELILGGKRLQPHINIIALYVLYMYTNTLVLYKKEIGINLLYLTLGYFGTVIILFCLFKTLKCFMN